MEKSQPNLSESKQTRKPRKRAREFIEDGKSRRKTFMKRVPTLKKKAEELAELCGIPVCVVCFGPDGTVDVWPEDRTKAEAVIMKYKERSSDCMQKLNLSGILEIMDKKEKQRPWQFLDKQLHKLSLKELQDLIRNLDSKILTVEERIRFLKGKSVQIFDLGGAEEVGPLSIELPDHFNDLYAELPDHFNDLYRNNNSNMEHEKRSSFPDCSYMAMLMASDDQTDFTIPSTDTSRLLGYYSEGGCSSNSSTTCWLSGGIPETNLGNNFLSRQAGGVWQPTPLHEVLPITAVWPRQPSQSQMNYYGDTDHGSFRY